MSTTSYFRRVYTDYTMNYAVFSEGGYYLYYVLRIIFGGWILFILCTTQYFRGEDTIYTMYYAVFSGGGYCLYYEIRSIFGGWVQFILCATQYFRGADTVPSDEKMVYAVIREGYRGHH